VKHIWSKVSDVSNFCSICFSCEFYDWAIIFNNKNEKTMWEHTCNKDKEYVGDDVKECDAFSEKRKTK
jgi:hypothetical protein